MRYCLLFLSALVQLGCPGGASPSADAGVAPADAGSLPELVWHEVVNSYAPGAVLSVWSSSPENVWMVGGELGHGFVLHFDGQSWTHHDPGTTEQLWWVHGWSDGTVMVVGERGQTARWDGSTWTQHPAQAPGVVFYGIWGATPDDVWAVGGAQPEAPEGTELIPNALYHFDGQTWSLVELPPMFRQGEGENLFKVWGSDAESVFIVGTSGMAWHKQSDGWSGRVTPVNNGTLFTLSGRSYDDIYAVGGMGSALMIHWDGRVWKNVVLPDQSPTSMPGVWTAPQMPVYVAGARGFTGRLDGEDWTTAWVDTAQSFHAIHFDGRRLWAVGGDIDARRDDHIGAIFCSEPVPAP